MYLNSLSSLISSSFLWYAFYFLWAQLLIDTHLSPTHLYSTCLTCLCPLFSFLRVSIFHCNSFQDDLKHIRQITEEKEVCYLCCLGWNRGRLLTKQSNFPAQRQRESNLSSAHESQAGRRRVRHGPSWKMGRKLLFVAEAPASICCSKKVRK